MKCCLSGRQPFTLLDKADEIKIRAGDFRALPDYIERFPEKTLIIELNEELPEFLDFELAKVYSEKMNGNFYIAVDNISQIELCKHYDLKFYYKYTITSFFELQSFKNMGVSYAKIGVPLIFDLKNVAKCGVPLRVVPNLAYEPYMSLPNGIQGGWIRPEDIDKYGEYIAAMEFYAPGMLEKEAALYRVYVENKKWPGNLNLLIDNLNYDFDNNLLYDEENFAIRRMGCKNKCMVNNSCHYCSLQFEFAPKILSYRDKKRNS